MSPSFPRYIGISLSETRNKKKRFCVYSTIGRLFNKDNDKKKYISHESHEKTQSIK